MRGRSVLMWSVADILVRCPFPGRVGRVVFGCSEFAVTTDVCVCVARILYATVVSRVCTARI